MDREYYSPMDSYLTPEQIRHEEESSFKIDEKNRKSKIGMFRTLIRVGGATFLALKGPGLFTKVMVPTLTGFLTSIRASDYTYKVSIFFK